MNTSKAAPLGRRPDWLKVKLPTGVGFRQTESIVARFKLNTVCQDALCPNLSECWSKKAATFMILGDVCTRNCHFCAVPTGKPAPLDLDEPKRVAEAVSQLGLRYIVLTSVNRDDLDDGGAFIFAKTIQLLHQEIPGCLVEVLIPDFQGEEAALNRVMKAKPDILNHNVETVPRLYPRMRPQAKYQRTLKLLHQAKQGGMTTKTGLMVGVGETMDEIKETLQHLVEIQLDILTIGQYLQPSQGHLPVERFVHPDEFKALKQFGESIGIAHVESGPLVRSSYHAGDVHKDLQKVKVATKMNR